MRWLSLIFLPSVAYQVVAIAGGLRHLYKRSYSQRRTSHAPMPGVSVLKPVRGLDPNTYEAFVSQVHQDYPRYEILFGVRDESDPAIPVIRQVQREFPNESIRLIVGGEETSNGKVGVLMNLGRHANYPIWVVNDSDIKVTPFYLRAVTAPLSNESVGVVTCLYRAKAHSVPAAWEALGIATDFMPSILVAPLVGVHEFGLGSTLAFRAHDFCETGGFEALADYLADDYQLAKRINGLGKRTLLSTYVVETALADVSWVGIWQHQLRWARTIRLSKGSGYAGLPVTHAGVWAVFAALVGAPIPGVILASLRILSGLITGVFVLESTVAKAFCWLAPVWDIYAFGVWIASYSSRQVRWRERVLTVNSAGRLQPSSSNRPDAC